ncbi:hypothetical protein GCM10009798_31670 [Nocardioides panacihumi]|uniref:Uncharacterized protein n=2 Tax=Nocardioides panacihumi TaxID=400774 RepID=A0ABN2RH39_9ACTN
MPSTLDRRLDGTYARTMVSAVSSDHEPERFKHLPPPIPRERLVADRGTDAHEEWDDAFREMTWFVTFVG